MEHVWFWSAYAGVGVLLVVGAWYGNRWRRLNPARVDASAGQDAGCGNCGYSVRGLPGNVCPECGSDLNEVGRVSPKFRRWQAAPPLLRAAVFVLAWLLVGGLANLLAVAERVPTTQRRLTSELLVMPMIAGDDRPPLRMRLDSEWTWDLLDATEDAVLLQQVTVLDEHEDAANVLASDPRSRPFDLGVLFEIIEGHTGAKLGQTQLLAAREDVTADYAIAEAANVAAELALISDIEFNADMHDRERLDLAWQVASIYGPHRVDRILAELPTAGREQAAERARVDLVREQRYPDGVFLHELSDEEYQAAIADPTPDELAALDPLALAARTQELEREAAAAADFDSQAGRDLLSLSTSTHPYWPVVAAMEVFWLLVLGLGLWFVTRRRAVRFVRGDLADT